MNKSKWEYSKLSKPLKGWREDIKIQIWDIGQQNIKHVKTRNAGYVNEECYAVLWSGEQIQLGIKT